MAQHHARVLILGSGPAGYTAAIYAARALMEPVLIAGLQPGGQMTITTEVENYPGFADAIQGPWLMEQMRAQALNVGTRMVSDTVVEADIKHRPFRLTLDGGDVWTADVLIVATGAQARWLGLPSEERFKGFGVSACATCDGFFFKGKDVLVVGGGNTAVEEAIYLAHLARKVTVVHRRDSFRAERIMQDRLFKRDNVEVIWDTELDEVLGKGGFPPSVTGARLKNLKSGEKSDISVDGIFIAIGHEPAVSLFREQLALKPSGYILTAPGSTTTSVPGVFAAGDVTDEVFRQAVTAAGMGCMAALQAEKYLFSVEATREAAE